jgi:hypothetical protein
MDLKEAGWEILGRSNLAKDRNKGQAVVNMVRCGNIWLAQQMLLSEEEHCSF